MKTLMMTLIALLTATTSFAETSKPLVFAEDNRAADGGLVELKLEPAEDGKYTATLSRTEYSWDQGKEVTQTQVIATGLELKK